MIRIPRRCAASTRFLKSSTRAVVLVDGVEVGDVVAAVAQRAPVHREQPDAVDPEPLQVVELLLDPAQVARAVVVGVEEPARVDLVEDGALEPQRIGLEPLAGLAHSERSAAQHVGLPRAEADVVAPDVPGEGLVGEELADADGRRQPDPRGQDDDALALLDRVEVHCHDHHVIVALLGEREQVVVLGVEPGEIEPLQRRVLAPDRVQPADEREQRPVERALLRLVLLGVEVLLRALAQRDVLDVLVAGVEAVARRERRRRGRAAPRTRAGRPAAGSGGGCPACSRRSSAGSSRVHASRSSTNSTSSHRVFFQVKYV